MDLECFSESSRQPDQQRGRNTEMKVRGAQPRHGKKSLRGEEEKVPSHSCTLAKTKIRTLVL